MRTEAESLRFQADEHPLVPTGGFGSLEEYVLYLIHLAAYEEAAKYASGKAVLDIGCNVGYGTAIVARPSLQTTGVDVSSKSIAAATAQHAAPNLRFVAIDGLTLPFADASFDLVVSFQVIEHIFAPEGYLREIRRVLRPEGTAIITTPNAPLRLDPGMKPWNPFHVREFSAAALEELLHAFFGPVRVAGLFATPELYEVEYARLQRCKENARRQQALQNTIAWKAKRALKDAAKAVLPAAAAGVLRRALYRRDRAAPAEEKTLDPSLVEKYSTADFSYRTGELDGALDLMAICTNAPP